MGAPAVPVGPNPGLLLAPHRKSATMPDERFGLVYGMRRGPSAKQTEGP
jgi:hypothetical protein